MRKISLITLLLWGICNFALGAGGILPGSGTESDPWIIEDVDDFDVFSSSSEMWIADTFTSLAADIDLGDAAYTSSVVGTYSGSFDGAGHVISHFSISGDSSYVGLFSQIEGSVSNLGVQSCTITGNGSYRGSLVGNNNSGSLYRCFAEDVQVAGNTNVGGLVGQSHSGSVSECYASGVLVNASNLVGGLCGQNNRGTISNCYSSGIVRGSSTAGGFCGYNDHGTITTCYSSVVVSGGGDAGGFLGSSYYASMTDCYFYRYGGRDNTYGVDLDNAQMLTEASYAGFSFDGVWSIDEGNYPKLDYQTTTGPVSMVYQLSTTLSGSGTAVDPFLISDSDDLMEFATNISLRYGCYQLTADIDLGEQVFTSAVIPGRFLGYFDGAGHVISHFSISGDNNTVGLFAQIDGSVSHLGVQSCAITGNGNNRGSLVGYIYFGSINRCFAEDVQVAGNTNVGGLVGYSYSGSISECYASDVLVNASDAVGGLCGQTNRGTINNCYSSGIVRGSSTTGGLCGYSDHGTITTSYSSAVVSGGGNTGGFLGNSYYGSLADCYFYRYGGRDNTIGVDLDNVQMLAEASYSGFDFAEVWIVENGFYPKLNYQANSGPVSMVNQLSTTLSGSGTAVDPFLIGSYDDLMEFATNLSLRYGCYQLTADIDLGEQVFTSAVIPERFLGYFDGAGYTISNFSISGDSSSVGLFAQMDGRLTDLGVQSCEITGNGNNRGALVGYIYFGSINRCFAEDVQVGGNTNVGGLVGYSYSGSISECYASDVLVNASDAVGGLCGQTNRSTINNSYSSGIVRGSSTVGGFCGYSDHGTITTSYSSAVVTGGGDAGGFLGRSYYGTLSDCYFYRYGGRDNAIGVDLDNAQMLTEASYSGFSFDGIWAIDEGYYPKLDYQLTTGPVCMVYQLSTTLSGSGTAEDPFLISSSNDLMEFATNNSLRYGCYELTDNIDLEEQVFTEAVISERFLGQFDGLGHMISNFTISGDSGNMGLFYQLDGRLANLGVQSCSIIGNGNNRGSLVGYNYFGSIYRCFVEDVHVAGNNNIGGIVGYSYSGSISECYASDVEVNGNDSIAGVCGLNNRSAIVNSYASGSVNGNTKVGGFCGYSDHGTITTCYSAVAVVGNGNVGGFLGHIYYGSVTGSFWDMDVSGQATSSGGTGKTTAEMLLLSTFTDANWSYLDDINYGVWFDFENDYPRLVWEVVTVPSVEGLAYDLALGLIDESGIRLGDISYAYSFVVPAGSVIEQDIAAGELLSHRGRLSLVISKGPELTIMPDLYNLPEAEAETAITDAKLAVGDISYAYSFDIPAGNVISQSIPADFTVVINSDVDLVLSNGPEYTTVPDVSGMTEAQAVLAIMQSKLAVAEPIVHQYDAEIPSGYVVSQSIVADESVMITTEVALVISDGPEMVGVPSLYDMNLTEAMGIIEAASLEVGTITYDYSFTVAHGNVIGQSIAGGGTAVIGSAVNLVVSDGPQIITMPDFTGMDQAEAEAAILDAGLVVGTHVEHYSFTVSEDAVISQNLLAGNSYLIGSTVSLVISKGSKMTTVPSVTGINQALAEAMILAADLTVGDIATEYSLTVPEGVVLSQSLTAGESVVVESPVNLVVSAGPEMVIVPDIADMTEAEAESELTDSQLNVGNKTYEYSLAVPDGTIISQSVDAGESIVIHSSVDLVISKGSLVVMPDVVGMEQEQAESIIISEELTVGMITTDFSMTVPIGDVISQSVAAGVSVQFNSTIDLVVSSGPEMVIVPNLVNLTETEAEAVLLDAKLVLGSVSYGISYTVDIDNIMSQNIRKGSTVVAGSAVDITISNSATRINMEAFSVLSSNWMVTVTDGADGWDSVDFNSDSTIDYSDLQLLLENWLSTDKITVEQVEADYFESGDFASLNWENDDLNPWAVLEEPYRGAYAAKSGGIDDLSSTSLSLAIDTTGYNTISFVGKVSSELDYDYLLFYVDGKLADSFSGEIDWSVYSYTIKTEGIHTFKWTYEKDESISEGQDCAWIDDIVISKK